MKEGTLVAVWRDNGEVYITTTKGEDFADQTGTQVVHLRGISGWYALSHVRPIIGLNIHPLAAMPLVREAVEAGATS